MRASILNDWRYRDFYIRYQEYVERVETMRKLTFEGFLKQYVAELSEVQTASVHKLADRMAENPRLKEPLFL